MKTRSYYSNYGKIENRNLFILLKDLKIISLEEINNVEIIKKKFSLNNLLCIVLRRNYELRIVSENKQITIIPIKRSELKKIENFKNIILREKNKKYHEFS